MIEILVIPALVGVGFLLLVCLIVVLSNDEDFKDKR